MKTKLKLSLVAAAALLVAPFASAQLTLQNFSAFESPNTYFIGDWELNSDVAGSNSPRFSFSQGAGFYTFAGGSNSDTSSAFYLFNAPIDITGLSFLQLSARLEAGNMAPEFTVTLFDSFGETAYATLVSSTFSETNFSTFSMELTSSSGFNASDLSAFEISGKTVGGVDLLNISIDNLAVSVPVPEPSTYGLIGGALMGVLIFVRRLRRNAA
jgi:hypothetical protein